MVYRGKPSAACGECRKRRSRCDQSTPACGQCVKAGRICPGYRNTVDLMFHDESKRIVQRNRSRIANHPESHELQQDFSKQKSMQVAVAAPVKLTDFVLYQPLDDLGISFFMSSYISSDPSVSQLYYLPDFYAKVGYSNPGLQQSITAAGLAGYAKATRQQDLVNTATKHYIAAIRGINAAISDTETAAQDSTLLSIIMVAMFEALINPRLSGMEIFAKHLDGAVAIAILQLKQGKFTDVTHKLVTTLVQTIVVNCWVTHMDLPRDFAQLAKRLKKESVAKVDPSFVHRNFLEIVLELVLFREALRKDAYQHPMAIIRQAQNIDNSLANFARVMPRRALFKAFQVPPQGIEQLAYNGYYHVYPQRFTAHLWNSVRSSRLRLHQVILRQCRILLSSLALPKDENFLVAQKEKSEAEIVHFALEISATVPQLAGYLEQNPVALPPPTRHIFANTVEYKSHLPYDHGPFGETDDRDQVQDTKPGQVSVLYAECNDATTKVGVPTRSIRRLDETNTSSTCVFAAAPLANGPQPASVYHMLFQLYGMRSIPIIPKLLKAWMCERIRWMEYHTEPDDLARLQAMMAGRPGDGFPVDHEE
ncbi:hypothetical protein CC86DRAFT_293941 [Ophiobolus disseminans]|uniref:Zn(2)-C6 fungal-type domain-containing protein n=1 Tax=Ophiobolus disseminans TaxID=1469910 RepID=A0A6A6ZY08_9PLEO|nr:hypothetical protein CC86DRAFT_293941 [Ophiobolus disseminans]